MPDYDDLLNRAYASLDLDAVAQILATVNEAHKAGDYRQLVPILLAFLRTIPEETHAEILLAMVKQTLPHEREQVQNVMEEILPQISPAQAVLYMKALVQFTIEERDRQRGHR